MGVNRRIKHVELDDEVVKSAYEAFAWRFRASKLTEGEIKTFLESNNLSEIAASWGALSGTLDFLLELTRNLNLYDAMNTLSEMGIPIEFLAGLAKRGFYMLDRRKRGYLGVTIDDVKHLWETKENLDHVKAILLNAYVTVPEYYKLKKMGDYDSSIEYIGGYDALRKAVKLNRAESSKILELVKNIIKVARALENVGIKVEPDTDVPSSPYKLVVGIKDLEFLIELDDKELQELKEMMEKYGLTPEAFAFFGDRESRERFGKAAVNLVSYKKTELLRSYYHRTKGERDDQIQVILLLAENNILPDTCYAQKLGLIGCKYCRYPCDDKEKAEAAKSVCGGCFYYKYKCFATYKNFVGGKCNLMMLPEPPTESTLRYRF